MKHSIIEGSKTRVAAALYMAVIFIMLAFLVKHAAVLEEEKRITETPDSIAYFENLPLEAEAVYVYDTVTNRPLFGKNEHLPLPLASITKVMTAVCALDNLNQDGYIVIPQSVLGEDGDRYLESGKTWRIGDLVSYMLVKSSNDAAVALSATLGGTETMVACMNRKAEEMELFDTRFDNESGLDIGTKPGAYGSAEDATQLLLKAANAYPEVFGSTRYESYNVYDGDTVYAATNTNKVQSMIIGMKASKTGLTDLAGGNLVFEMDAGLGHSVMIAILGSSEDGRFRDALILSEAVINYLGKTK